MEVVIVVYGLKNGCDFFLVGFQQFRRWDIFSFAHYPMKIDCGVTDACI